MTTSTNTGTQHEATRAFLVTTHTTYLSAKDLIQDVLFAGEGNAADIDTLIGQICQAVSTPHQALAVITALDESSYAGTPNMVAAIAALNAHANQLEASDTSTIEQRIEYAFAERLPRGHFGTSTRFDIPAFIDYFYENVARLLLGTDGNLWYFNPTVGREVTINGTAFIDTDGPYVPTGEDIINAALSAVVDKNTATLTHSILSYVRGFNRRKGRNHPLYFYDPRDVNADRIPFLNGVLNWRTLELEPYSASNPHHRFPGVIPHNWNPDATCPRLESGLRDIFDGQPELQDLYFHILGQELYWGKPVEPISWWLYGQGRNGKSILGDYAGHIAGAALRASVIPQRMDTNRFAAADLDGKLINIVNDNSGNKFEDTGMFKMAVSGEPLTVERKNKDAYEITPRATHIICTNSEIRADDLTIGFRRRICVVPFNQMFAPNPGPGQKKEDNNFFADITTQSEVEGAIVRAVNSLRDYTLTKEYNRRPEVRSGQEDAMPEWQMPEVCVREFWKHMRGSNSVVSFLWEVIDWEKTSTQFGSVDDPQFRVHSLSSVYEAYKMYHTENGCAGRPMPRHELQTRILSTALEAGRQVKIEKDPITNQLIIAGLRCPELLEHEAAAEKSDAEIAEMFGLTVEELHTRRAISEQVEANLETLGDGGVA